MQGLLYRTIEKYIEISTGFLTMLNLASSDRGGYLLAPFKFGNPVLKGTAGVRQDCSG